MVLLCLFILVMVTGFQYDLILPVLVLEGSVIDLGFFGEDVKEFDLGEKPLFMRFFGHLLGIILGQEFGRD